MLTSLFAAFVGVGQPLIMVHMMPWFSAPPTAAQYGWHWTMNKVDPATGRAASHYTPQAGFYDSSDPLLIDYQLQLMKIAGIDGIWVDWYGDREYYDYLALHRVTEALFSATQKFGLKFGVVYEDQSAGKMVEGGLFPRPAAVANLTGTFSRLGQWMRSPHYIRLEGRPVLAVFGPQFLTADEWPPLLLATGCSPILLSLHDRKAPAEGGFDWPLPSGGWAAAREKSEQYFSRAQGWKVSMPVAYPRFHDYYAEAGLHPSYGRVEDRDGQTFVDTWNRATDAKPAILQIATWNDWGEGTMVEPSVQFGTRDLAFVQSWARTSGKRMPWSRTDLDLPLRILRARRTGDSAADAAARAILMGNVAAARRWAKVGPAQPDHVR